MISLNAIKGPDICSIYKEHTKENLEAKRLSGDYSTFSCNEGNSNKINFRIHAGF